MDSLIQDLQKTIEALETLSEKPATAGEQIDEWLDQLFQQKIDLVNASLNASTQPYQQASQAMKHAATKAMLAVQEPAKFDGMGKAVADAITKLAKLLDGMNPIN